MQGMLKRFVAGYNLHETLVWCPHICVLFSAGLLQTILRAGRWQFLLRSLGFFMHCDAARQPQPCPGLVVARTALLKKRVDILHAGEFIKKSKTSVAEEEE